MAPGVNAPNPLVLSNELSLAGGAGGGDGGGDGNQNSVQKSQQEQLALELAKTFSFDTQREITQTLVCGHG
jgi:hypothetical protein